jgi:ECF sigma factor
MKSRILNAIDQGEPNTADHLLPLVSKDLRNLAAQKLAQEPGRYCDGTEGY